MTVMVWVGKKKKGEPVVFDFEEIEKVEPKFTKDDGKIEGYFLFTFKTGETLMAPHKNVEFKQ